MSVRLVIVCVIVAAFHTDGFEGKKESKTSSNWDDSFLINEEQFKHTSLNAITLEENRLKSRQKRQTVMRSNYNYQPRKGPQIQGSDNSPTVFVYLEDDKDLESLLRSKKIDDIVNTAERNSQSFNQPNNNNQYYAIPISTDNESKLLQYPQQNNYANAVKNARPKNNNYGTENFPETIIIYENQPMTNPSEKVKNYMDAPISFYSDSINFSKDELDFIKSSLQQIKFTTNSPTVQTVYPSDVTSNNQYLTNHSNSLRPIHSTTISSSKTSFNYGKDNNSHAIQNKTMYVNNGNSHIEGDKIINDSKNFPESGDKRSFEDQSSYEKRPAEDDRDSYRKKKPFNDRSSNARPLEYDQESYDRRLDNNDQGSANYEYDRESPNFNRDSSKYDRSAQDYYPRPSSYDRGDSYNRGPPYGRGPPSRGWGGPPYGRGPPSRGRGGPPYGRGRGKPPHNRGQSHHARDPPYTINLNFPNGTSAAVQYGNATMSEKANEQDQNPDIYETLKSIFSPKPGVTLSNDDNGAPLVKVPETATYTANMHGLFQVTPVTPAI